MNSLLKIYLILCIFLSSNYLYSQENGYEKHWTESLDLWNKERYVKSARYQLRKMFLITSLLDNTINEKQRDSISKELRRMEEDEQQIKRIQENKKRILENFEKVGLRGLLKPMSKTEKEELWKKMKKKKREKRTQESTEEKECLYIYEEIDDNSSRFKQKLYYVNKERIKFRTWLDVVGFSADEIWIVLRFDISIWEDMTDYISSFSILQIVEYMQKQQVESVKGVCAVNFSNGSTKEFHVQVTESEDESEGFLISITFKSYDDFELFRKVDITGITLCLNNGEILDSWKTPQYKSAEIIDSMLQFHIKKR